MSQSERLRPDPRRSRLDVNIQPGRVDVYEHYSADAAGKLRRRLRELGIRTRVSFRSPCG